MGRAGQVLLSLVHFFFFFYLVNKYLPNARYSGNSIVIFLVTVDLFTFFVIKENFEAQRC